MQTQLTGVMNVRPVAATRDTAHGDDETMFAHLVAPRVRAPNHQHFFNWRLDLDVDGDGNRVLEMNTSNAQAALRDRSGEWFGMRQTTLKSEISARRDMDCLDRAPLGRRQRDADERSRPAHRLCARAGRERAGVSGAGLGAEAPRLVPRASPVGHAVRSASDVRLR